MNNIYKFLFVIAISSFLVSCASQSSESSLPSSESSDSSYNEESSYEEVSSSFSSSEDTRSDLEKEFDNYPSDIRDLFNISIGERAIPYIAGTSYQGANSNYANTDTVVTSLAVYGVLATSFDEYSDACEKHGFIIDSETDDKYNYAYLQGSDGVTLIVSFAYFNKAYPYFLINAYLY